MKHLLKILLLGLSFHVAADDLGVIGKTYQINEPDMIEWIKSRASSMMQSGEWEQIQKQAIDRTRNYINHPPAIANITDATETKSWHYTPVVQIKEDLTDGQGHTLAKAGQYNALRYKPFDVQLLFINGDNPKQVQWALAKNKESDVRTKIVLTSGSFMDLDKEHKVWFYYDQGGKYTQKLNITHVPAIVKQDGTQLKITEISNNEL